MNHPIYNSSTVPPMAGTASQGGDHISQPRSFHDQIEAMYGSGAPAQDTPKIHIEDMDANEAQVQDIPEIDFMSRCLFGQIAKPGLIVLSATTGNFKTTLGLNIATAEAESGKKVLFLSLEQPAAKIFRRLYSIWTNQPHAEAECRQHDPAIVQAIASRIRIHDLSKGASPNDVLGEIQRYINAGVRVVVVDGAETVSGHHPGPQALKELIAGACSLANQFELPIVISGQLNREGYGVEVPSLKNLSETSDKAQRPEVAVMLGKREETLITLTMSKERDRRQQDAQEVYRLLVRPSLRLEVMDADPLPPLRCGPPPAMQQVNARPGDLPADQGEDDSIDPDEGTVEVIQPTMGVYHGLKGFVPIGREFFASPMFANRKADDVLHMLDLYQMAHFQHGTMTAPRTSVPVPLERGQAMTSVRMLSNNWQVTEKVVRGFLERAEREGLIRTELVDSEGQRMPKSESMGTSKAGRGRALCQVVTCCHYGASGDTTNSSRKGKGTSNGTPKDTTGAQQGHDEGT